MSTATATPAHIDVLDHLAHVAIDDSHLGNRVMSFPCGAPEAFVVVVSADSDGEEETTITGQTANGVICYQIVLSPSTPGAVLLAAVHSACGIDL